MNANDPITDGYAPSERTDAEMSTAPSEPERPWLEPLRAGRADEALRRYREAGAPDRALEGALGTLRELQARLREREYRRSQALAAGLTDHGVRLV